MFSFRALTSIPIKPRKRKKQVFKLPQEVTNLKFYPLDEKQKKYHSGNGDSDEDNIQEAINEVLSHNYKNRSLDFIDPTEIPNSDNEQSIEQTEDEAKEQLTIQNSPQKADFKEQPELSISNLMVFDSAPVDEIENNNTNEIITESKPKISKKQPKKKCQNSKNTINEQQISKENDAQINIQQSETANIENHEQNAVNVASIENHEQNTVNVASNENTDNKSNEVSLENKENPFRREAHCFCTFPKRKPNPVTPEVKKLIAKQRIFEHKTNYYPEALTSSSDSEDFDSFHIHHDTQNNFDWNHHRRSCKSDIDDENDPRFYKPEIPELTRNPRSVSRKLCQSILKKTPKSNKQSLTPTRPREQFNNINVYIPPEKLDVSIFYPKKEVINLESEESFLLHPDKPLISPVRKCNNSLFKSNIHFCDFDSDHKSNSSKPDVDKLVEAMQSEDIEEASDENDDNENNKENVIDDHRHDLNYARRFPEKYLQSLVEEN